MTSLLDRLSYKASQRLRTGWFSGHYAATARLSPPITKNPKPKIEKSNPKAENIPSAKTIAQDLQELFERDWANIEAGLYQAPEDQWPNPFRVLQQSTRYFRDLQNVNKRKSSRHGREVAETGPAQRLPDYYVQNFHYQTDGYLSAESAQLYDYQVEVLFTGGADAMRRQALVPIGNAIRQTGVRQSSLLDIGCGTGRFLQVIKQNFPRLWVTGLDLSEPYLQKAKTALSPWSRNGLAQGLAEGLPFADHSFDVISCVYLFHELPRPIRRKAALEMRRVLKPDGIVVFMDSLQPGDFAAFDPLLNRFPEATHEPYYADYLKDDLAGMFSACGLESIAFDRAFFSRIMVLRPRR